MAPAFTSAAADTLPSSSLPPGTRVAKISSAHVSVPSTLSAGSGGLRAGEGAEPREQFLWGGDSPVEFADTRLPLVVDVGCGFGVSLLGLAAVEHAKRGGGWHNYLGCDLSSHCIAYASGAVCVHIIIIHYSSSISVESIL